MANWVDWREGATTLEGTAIHRTSRIGVSVAGEPFRATGAGVSGDFFRTVRPRFVAGRGFTDDEGQRGDALAVVGSNLAARRFGSPEAALGNAVVFMGMSFTVVGVVDGRYAFPEGAELWLPGRWEPGSGAIRNNINYAAVGRLARGRTVEQARSELDAVARGIRETDPEAVYSYGVGVLPLRDVVVGDAGSYLTMLMAAVVGVLLVACANLAGLSLARARSREREVAVRLALGSSRGRLARQLLTMHATLAAVGGGLGLGAAALAIRVLSVRIDEAIPRAGDLSVDLRVAGFTLALSLAAGVAAGALPALRGAGVDPGRGLRSGRAVARGGRGLPGGVLVGAEVALALTIMIAGGLLLRSFQSVLGRDLGYDPEGVVTAEVTLAGPDYADDRSRVSHWSGLLEALRAVPGVEAAAVGNWVPTGGSGTGFIELPDVPEPDFGAGYRVVSEEYFEALGMRLVEGRALGAQDAAGGERVTVVNRRLAEQAWPAESPLGRRIKAVSMEMWLYDGEAPWLTVVGVVDDVRHSGFESEPAGEMYVHFRQVPEWTTSMTAVVRAEPGAGAAVPDAIRERVSALDPSVATEIGTLDRRVFDLLAERRLILSIALVFAVTALALVSLGVYGLVAFAAAQRTREMAIRLALGTRRGGLLRTVLASAARVIAAGALIGLAAAAWLTGLLDALLVDVAPLDAPTYVGAVALLTLVGLAAALGPAVRAMRSDPMSVLGRE
jgi:predicted permease